MGGATSAPNETISRRCLALLHVLATTSCRFSAQPAALVVHAEEVLRAGRGHRSRGADLEGKRGGGDDLREPVHLARACAADRREPVARRGKRRAAADRADLEAREPDGRLEP